MKEKIVQVSKYKYHSDFLFLYAMVVGTKIRKSVPSIDLGTYGLRSLEEFGTETSYIQADT